MAELINEGEHGDSMFFLITGSVDVFVKDKIVTTLGQARAHPSAYLSIYLYIYVFLSIYLYIYLYLSTYLSSPFHLYLSIYIGRRSIDFVIDDRHYPGPGMRPLPSQLERGGRAYTSVPKQLTLSCIGTYRHSL